MAEVNCVNHADKKAVGFCSRCIRSYCSDCLDLEMGQPLCVNCKKSGGSASAAGAPPVSKPAVGTPSSSPLNFKGKGLDDDPLGLFGGGPSPAPMPKMDAPKLNPLPTPSVPSVPITPPKPVVPSPLPNLDLLGGPTSDLGKPSATPSKPSMDLNSMIHEPQPLRPPFPKASEPLTTPSSAPLPFPAGTEDLKVPQKNKALSLTKIWAKYLIRRSYEVFDPVAKKLRVPTYVFLGLAALIIVGAIVGIGSIANQPSVALASTVQPIHMVIVNSSQISEMDVTAYSDIQNQLQTMGFTPIVQMTVPQLPSPNFFDVGMKDNVGTYSEIIKVPGQITPRLSFVSVFTNGTWFSTNAWQGTNQELDYLISEFYPSDTPDQLYVQHIQTLEKLKQDKDWQVQTMGENRYMAALSDHLRWFLDKKGIQGYQADFSSWH